MPNLSEFEEFATRIQSLVTDGTMISYQKEWVYPGLVIEQGEKQGIQIVLSVREMLQLIPQQSDCITPKAQEIVCSLRAKLAMAEPFELSPLTATLTKAAIHVEYLGQSMCLVTILSEAELEVIEGGDWLEACTTLIRTNPAIGEEQLILTLVTH